MSKTLKEQLFGHDGIFLAEFSLYGVQLSALPQVAKRKSVESDERGNRDPIYSDKIGMVVSGHDSLLRVLT